MELLNSSSETDLLDILVVGVVCSQNPASLSSSSICGRVSIEIIFSHLQPLSVSWQTEAAPESGRCL